MAWAPCESRTWVYNNHREMIFYFKHFHSIRAILISLSGTRVGLVSLVGTGHTSG
jgi:hypothetical protein